MIVDLFSHKIHSTGDDWPEKLAELAAIFGEFNGELFDRGAFEERLQRISPRVSYLAAGAAKPSLRNGRKDASKFRDEISAYPAFLGLYFLEQSPAGWVVRITETAKRFLLREEPDVASFLRLQLPLFQYPNGIGAVYAGSANKLHIQANTRDKTLEFINQGIHLSPLRLIAVALKADALLRNASILNAHISFTEIFGLANNSRANKDALPSIEKIAEVLDGMRRGLTRLPAKRGSRFHTLRHTEMFEDSRGTIKLRHAVNEADGNQLIQRLNAICSIGSQFEAFDNCKNAKDIESVIGSGKWGRYFDGVKALPSEVVEVLTDDKALEARQSLPNGFGESAIISQPVAEIYPLKERASSAPPPVNPYDRRREMADPELTRVKRQRRNLAHKELIDKMDIWLRALGAMPKENDHIDLFAKIPSDGSFIFEMKSGGDSLLDQIRKGLSQLYEYRYRYKDAINDNHISLCLVLPERPDVIPWITKYLCEDRGISICWFEEGGRLAWPAICSPQMEVLKGP